MSLHISSIPLFKCYIRKEFLYNLESDFGEFENTTVFGISCIKGRAPLFHCLLPNGAIYYRVPPIALTTDKSAPKLDITDCVYWDAFSYYFTIHRFDLLRECDCTVLLKNGEKHLGQYMFTIDWFDPDGDLVSAHAEIPDEHKCHHMIKLESGNFVLYPNNRILWREASFVVRDDIPDYKTNTHNWWGESDFKTENSDRMFYKNEKL